MVSAALISAALGLDAGRHSALAAIIFAAGAVLAVSARCSAGGGGALVPFLNLALPPFRSRRPPA
jgi:hypothetical protein